MSRPEPFSPLYRRLAIVVLALSAYAPTLKLGFMWDDHVMIESNPYIRSWTAANLKHDFTHDVFDGRGDPYYRPAQTIANRVDYTLWGLKPFGYHLTNFLAHAFNGILLSELALCLGLGGMTALLVGCLFAVHPMVVEQLMIIAGRAELLCLTFMLLTLLFLQRKRLLDQVLATAFFVVALLFKESAVMTPLLAALTYYVRREPRRTYLRLLPLIFVIPPYLWLRMHALATVLGQPDLNLLAKFFFMAFPKVLLKYAGLIFIPWNLHSHRLMPHLTYFWPVLLIALVGGIIYGIRKNRRLAVFCIGWYILVLVPKTPAMIYGDFMLDHWVYPAAFAILLPLAAYFTHLWYSRRKGWQNVVACSLFPLLIGWALLVHLNVVLRGTDEKMYRWALHFTTSNPIKYNLGILLMQSGRVPESLDYLGEVYDHYPEDSNNTNALAQAYWLIGDQRGATSILQGFLKLKPGDPLTLHNLEVIKTLAKRKAWPQP